MKRTNNSFLLPFFRILRAGMGHSVMLCPTDLLKSKGGEKMKEKRKDIFENYNKNPDEKDIVEVSSAPSGAGDCKDRPSSADRPN